MVAYRGLIALNVRQSVSSQSIRAWGELSIEGGKENALLGVSFSLQVKRSIAQESVLLDILIFLLFVRGVNRHFFSSSAGVHFKCRGC